MNHQLTPRMLDWLKSAASHRDGWICRNNIGNGGGTWGALARRGLIGEGLHWGISTDGRRCGYFLTPAGWAYLREQFGIERPADVGRLDLDEALAAAYPATAATFQAGDSVVCGDGVVRVATGTTARKGEPDRVVVEGGAEWLAADCWPATVEDRQRRRSVRVFYFLRTGGTPWGRQDRAYCDGMVDTAMQLGLQRTEMVQETVTWAPGETRPAHAFTVLRDSQPEEAPADSGQQVVPTVLPGDLVEATVAGVGAAQRAMQVRVDREPWPGGFGCTILSDGSGVHAVYTDSIHVLDRSEAAPEHEAIEGVVVEHSGTAEGSLPRHATHPNVTATREALGNFTPAILTDDHDSIEPTEAEQQVRGYLIDPREGDRVAVYWLVGGRAVRRDEMEYGAALDSIADRLRARGWVVEKMLRGSRCVFAHVPEDRPAPLVVRMGFNREDLDRIGARADADRAAWRKETDERRAAERQRYGATDTAAGTAVVR